MSGAAPSGGLAASELAAVLQRAWVSREPVEPLSAAEPEMTVERAYEVQRAWAELRVREGERTVGRKIGLTSPGMQQQMGVGEPDFGDLWGSRQYFHGDGGATIQLRPFLQPRVEGELAFLLERPLRGPGIGPDDVLEATTAIAPAIEIVDSRIRDWRIKLPDTIADNASYGGFLLGEWSEKLLEAPLAELPLELLRNGAVEVSERGSAVLGSPLLAVAWLANRLGDFGIEIAAGDIVLSGSFGPAVPVAAGDRFVVTVPGQAPLEAAFA